MAWRGLGDAIKWLTGLLGLVSCAACKRRQNLLNRLVPLRRKTAHEKMFDAQEKLWGKRVDEKLSAELCSKYRDTIRDFMTHFGEEVNTMKMEGIASFHVLFIEDKTLHCALVPPQQGGRFSISRKERCRIKGDLAKRIVAQTSFERLEWHE